ncbi:MAG TPA: histidine kinase [Candidatus Mediterraneibacter excrementigallinarum]|nr:histidine kinase [Candidatus Mediterraneibacter excrementigallinarum]
MKLRKKLFIILLFMALLPTVCITAVSYYRYQQTSQQQMQEYSENLFSKAVQQANSTLTELENATNLFSSYSSGDYSLTQNLRPFSSENASPDELSVFRTQQNIRYLCQNIINTYDFIYGIYIFTPSGINFTYENTQNVRMKYSYTPENSDWYEKTLEYSGNLYISDISVHDDIFQSSETSFFISKSLYDIYASENLGILLINCDPSAVDLSPLNTIPEVTSLIIADTSRDEVIYSTPSDRALPALDEIKENAAYSMNLGLPSLTLYTLVDYSRLWQEFSMTGIILIFISAACIVIGVILAFYFSKTVTKPIEHLSRKMSKQNGENLSPSTQYLDRTDEIGVLYNEYNSMIEALDTAIKTNYQNKLISLDAQMKSLEARINSHFLFNTLEAINSIASIEGSKRITTMAMSLGNMFRYAIKTQSELVTLQDEIDHIMDYISIQQIRFSNRFVFRLSVPEQMRNLKVLKLILQPIVENSFSHGLQNCQYGHRIHVYGFLREDYFLIYIVDDGKGMFPEQLMELNESLLEEPEFKELGHRTNQSIGLKNINTRIELYYGKGYGLSVQSRYGTGTMIRIKLPCLDK